MLLSERSVYILPTVSGEDLKRWLDEEERSAAWLARKLGVSRMAVSYWLTDQRPITAERADSIRAVFGAKAR